MMQTIDYQQPSTDDPRAFEGRFGAISLCVLAAALVFVITTLRVTSMQMGRDIPQLFAGPFGGPLLFGPALIGIAFGIVGIIQDRNKRWPIAGLVLNCVFLVFFCFPGFFWIFWILSDLRAPG